jgi:hypothetical protein
MIKILDFGIARNLESGFTRFTQIVGTPSYMSPEQAAGNRVDHRSDIFSIGAVFYELISYRRAFDGESHLTILDHIQRDEPVPLAQLSPGLDAGIFRIVDKALEKDPGRRYQDLETMRADVAAVRERLAQNAAEPTVMMPGAGAPSLVSPVASALEKRRAIQVKQALEAAEAAFARLDYEAAVESCEQVLLLEHSNLRALGLIDEARMAIDRLAIDRYVEEARGHVNAGEITMAEDAVAEALKLGAGNPAVLAMQKELGQLRRERERARERAASAGLAISRARASFAEGALDSALRSVREALVFSPDSSDAIEIKELVTAAIEKRRQEEELARRVNEAIHSAKQRFHAGDHDGAIEELERFTPATPAIAQVLNEFRQSIATMARLRQLEEERQRREAEEQRRREEEEQRLERERQRQQRIGGLIPHVERLAGAGDFDAALHALSDLEQLEADEAELARLRQLVASRREEAEAAARRTRRIDDHVAAATRLAGEQRLDEALIEIDAALQLDSRHARAAQLRAGVVRAIDERRRAEQREREIRESVAGARRMSDAGDPEGAVAALERLDQIHPLVASVLKECRTAAEAAALARIEERRRKDEEERLARERWVAERFQQARAALDAKSFDQALTVLNEISGRMPNAPGVSELRNLTITVRSDHEATERRRREIEQRLTLGREHLARRSWQAAFAEIDRALALDPHNDAAIALRRGVADAQRAEREAQEAAERERQRLAREKREAEEAAAERERQREIEQRLTLGREHLARRSWQAAFAEIDRALALDPHNDAAIALRRGVADAQRAEREAQEAAERERQRVAREKREAEEAAAERERQRLAEEQRRAAELVRVRARVEKQLSKNRFDHAEELIAAAETALGPSEELENLRLRINVTRQARTARAPATPVATRAVAVPAAQDDEATTRSPIVESPRAAETAPRMLPATAMPRLVGLAVIAVLALGLVVLGVKGWLRPPAGDSRRASTAPPPVESNPPVSPKPVPPPVTPEVTPPQPPANVPVTTPPVTANPPVTVTPPATPVPDPLARVRQQLRDQLTRGDRRQALATIGQGLASKPDEPEFVNALATMLRDAQADALRARDEAGRANATGRAEYEQGRSVFDRASARDRSRRTDAVADYWTAADLFRQATERTTPPRPEPVPVPATPQQPVIPPPAAQQPLTPPVQPRPQPSPPPQTSPPVQTPPAPPPPAADTVAADRQAINQVLDQYEAAYNTLNAAAVARVSHANSTSELEKLFENYRSLTVVLASRKIDVQGDTATVDCSKASNGVMKRANTRTGRTAPVTFKLQRAGRTWIIVAEQ